MNAFRFPLHSIVPTIAFFFLLYASSLPAHTSAYTGGLFQEVLNPKLSLSRHPPYLFIPLFAMHPLSASPFFFFNFGLGGLLYLEERGLCLFFPFSFAVFY